MPTAAKLVAALGLGALAVILSELIKAGLPEGMDFGLFTYVNAALGLCLGWLVIGSRAGRGFAAALSSGLTGAVALVFWGLFIQAVNEMVALALRRRYDGPVEATGAVFELMVEFGAQLLTGPIIATLLIGAMATGVVAELAARTWR